MTDINRKILEAMKKERDSTMTTEDQASVLQLIGRSFKGGAFRVTGSVVIFFQVLFAGLAVYCAYQMVQQPDIGIKMHWLTATLAAFVVFGLLRLWFFMELNRLSVLREVKRVELQLALLTEAISPEEEKTQSETNN